MASVSVSASLMPVLALLSLTITGVSSESDTLTPREEALVAKLRPLVSDFIYKPYMNKTTYLVRFLRVKNYDLTQARDVVKEMMAWRRKNKLDTVLTEDFSAVEKQFPVVFEGVDNYNRPIAVANIGIVDIRRLVISGQLDSFIRLFTAVFEVVEAVAREVQAEPGRENVTRAYLILDLAGFNLRQHWCGQCLQYVPFIFNTLENYYPDRIYRAVTVNTPRAFLPLYELARPFLSPPSQRSIKLLDYDTEKWKAFLRSEVPEDQLPIQYGGTRKVIPKTLSYLRKHDKYVKAAFEKAMLEVESEDKQQPKKGQGVIGTSTSTSTIATTTTSTTTGTTTTEEGPKETTTTEGSTSTSTTTATATARAKVARNAVVSNGARRSI